MKFRLLPSLFLLTFLSLSLHLSSLSRPNSSSFSSSHILGDSKINWNLSTAPQNTSQTITVTATIDGYLLDLIGWTSPAATVHLSATQTEVSYQTTADRNGLFVFHSTLLPLETGLFCFISEDTNQISSIPYCFPPPPQLTSLLPHLKLLSQSQDFDSSSILGDQTPRATADSGIVLAPSHSLKETQIKQDTLLATTGRTVPNSLVNIYLSPVDTSPWRELLKNIIHPSLAQSNHDNLYHSTFSGPDGSFTFNLPTDTTSGYEFVTNSATIHGLSAESNPLRYQLYNSFQWFFLKITNFFLYLFSLLLALLKNHLFIIFLELFILFFLLKKLFSSPPSAQIRFLPALYPKLLAPVSHFPHSPST
jgi:hypothetical protein